ncbi:CoxG family protein [Paraurantiacibacter namhicola]|uniref:Carbon monoxide dehydrogenase subunit G (CoxG) n=1 Tax=Paraurantiacibacter namhicola TaxID=645517 RepID=A0A1C7DAI6_9SPHN|nr:carbon monoxide dehydrogenase subunit G [Paraurantiacibacter namhicola]ANU08427.1 Carbon monoxide dehydrogenase subunit G (CoxG) [Paraurantiacibacter namhicola]
MEIKGTYQLPCSPQRAWEALNDPDLLKACLKGCERLEKTADDRFEGTVATKIGPVSARFDGSMTQTDVVAPDRCTMVFEGKGGVAGFAKGSADVTLEEAEGGTLLTYVADAKIGGKLAQMGARLVEGTARSMAEDFFGKFSAALAAEQGGAADAAVAAEAAATDAASAKAAGLSPVWIALIAVLAALLAIYWLA